MARKHLIIGYFYAPVPGPRSYRWTTLAEHFASNGAHVDFISAIRPGLVPKERRNGVNIYRVGGVFVDTLRARLGKSESHVSQNRVQPVADPPGRSISQGILSAVAKTGSIFHHTIWKNIYWPDVTCLWYLAVMRKVDELIRTHDYQSLITVSPSFTAHVAGYRIKKRCPDLPWLVDIGDPFCFATDAIPNNRHLYGRWNYTFEGRVFRRANSISVTTKATADEYASHFPESATKVTVIPPLLSLPPETGAPPVFPEDDKIRILYVGSLYKKIRRPDYLLALFTMLLKTPLANYLELHFFGNTSDCSASFEAYQHLMNEKIFLHGVVDRAVVTQAMREGSVLVNIGNTSRYQLPSKVVEYAALGKLIINIAQIEDDSSTAFFNDYPYALSLVSASDIPSPQQSKQAEEFIGHFPSAVNARELEQWTAPYKIENIADAYQTALGQVGS